MRFLLATARRRALATAAACGIALAAVIVGVAVQNGTDRAGAPSSASTAPRAGYAGGIQDPAAAAPARADGTPSRLVIPDIGVDVPLGTLSTDRTGKLLPPPTASGAGWYPGSSVPGRIGPAVIAGHVDYSAGPGVFERLKELQPGAVIEVQMSSGTTLRFRMTGSTESKKVDFPTSEVYGPTPDPQLRLITCAGQFDSATAHYLDNLVVSATEISDGSSS